MDARAPVSEIMVRNVVTTTPDSLLDQAARLLRENHVSGLPVLGPNGKVVGILSERDLVRDLHKATGIASPRGVLDLLLESAPVKGESLLEICRHRLERARVRELMKSPVVTVNREASLSEAARLMKVSTVNRLPVLDDEGRLVGIVTRGDIIAAISGATVRPRGALRPREAPTRSKRSGPDPYADA